MSDLAPDSIAREIGEARRAFKARDYGRAAAISRSVLAVEPTRIEAWNLLAIAAEESGRVQEAAGAYEQGILSTDGSPVLRNNLAMLLARLGDRAGARTQLTKAVEKDPGYAAAWSNLGSLLAASGERQEAENAFRLAISGDPTNALYPLDLAKLYLKMGQVRLAERAIEQADALFAQSKEARRGEFTEARADLAIAMGLAQRQLGNRLEEFRYIKQAIDLGAGHRVRTQFIEALNGADFIAPWPALKSILLRAFDENWGYTAALGVAALKLMLVEPEYQALLAESEAGIVGATDAKVARVAADQLLLRVLERTVVTSPDFERLAAGLRRAFLEASIGNRLDPASQDQLLPLCAAIANQCFSTGYAWSVTAIEQAELDKLTLMILESLGSGAMPSAFAAAALGSYGALHEFAHAEKFLEFEWPAALNSVLERQLTLPQQELKIRHEIRCVAPARGGVSERVRAQYEEDPYPMWLEPPRPPARRDPALWLKLNFPHAPAIEFGAAKPISILIAGCGTGNEPVGYSLALSGVAIRAFDLSLTSLAYAIRKTRALKLANIDYFQADLLELDDSIGSFDIVVAAGVLHHLERPAEGWGVLRDLTKPGGYMMTALYSERARRHVVEAQEFAKAGGYDTSRESLRRFRHDVYGLAEGAEWRADLLGREEFYTLGMLRDLVFHVQEQRFTPDGIMKCMSELGLEFQGFTLWPATEQLFRIKFGAGADFLSLAQWEEFEAEYPDTFSDMFHFLCRKPG